MWSSDVILAQWLTGFLTEFFSLLTLNPALKRDLKINMIFKWNWVKFNGISFLQMQTAPKIWLIKMKLHVTSLLAY